MKYYVIRHGKTDANRLTRAAYGQRGAPLNDLGLAQANALRQKLTSLGIDSSKEPVAVSELLRTHQTALAAGFKKLQTYKTLNEIKTADPVATNSLIQKGVVPREAKEAAQTLLANCPRERVWIAHGLVILGLMNEMKSLTDGKFLPDFCEIMVIDL